MRKTYIALFILVLAAIACCVASADDVITGSCGDNLTWTIENDVLTISGSGDMYRYGKLTPPPYFAYRTSFHEVVIEEGVSSIGVCAFYGAQMSKIEIPDSVETVNSGAFSNCLHLTSISFGSGVKTIGSNIAYADELINEIYVSPQNTYFSSVNNCLIENATKKLILCAKNASIPEDGSVEILGAHSFEDRYLKELHIPGSVKLIETDFSDILYFVESISVDEKNTVYKSVDNCIIEIDTGKLIKGCKNSIIPDDGSVTEIGPFAFECSGFDTIIIPESIEKIGRNAFANCLYLTTIDIPSSVKEIGDYVFTGCDRMKEVRIHPGVQSLGIMVFDDCPSLESIVLPETITNLASNLFSGCSSLKSVYLKNPPASRISIRSRAFPKTEQTKIYVHRDLEFNQTDAKDLPELAGNFVYYYLDENTGTMNFDAMDGFTPELSVADLFEAIDVLCNGNVGYAIFNRTSLTDMPETYTTKGKSITIESGTEAENLQISAVKISTADDFAKHDFTDGATPVVFDSVPSETMWAFVKTEVIPFNEDIGSDCIVGIMLNSGSFSPDDGSVIILDNEELRNMLTLQAKKEYARQKNENKPINIEPVEEPLVKRVLNAIMSLLNKLINLVKNLTK